jgi:hypothetical protein
MSNNPPLHSHHIFLFPFKWDYINDKKKGNFSQRTKVNDFDMLLDKNKWQLLDFTKDKLNHFNDHAYFYPFTRDAIFNLGKKNDDHTLLNNYEYRESSGGRYDIHIEKKDNKSFHYELSIDTIRLNIYDTGVGILSFHLSNYNVLTREDILRINDYGRRIYPQFLDTSNDQEVIDVDLLKATRHAFLAKSISATNAKGVEIFTEDFSYISKIQNLEPQNWALLSNDWVQKIFGKSFLSQEPTFFSEKYVVINPIIDDRMFVVSWYGNDTEIKALQQVNKGELPNYLQHDKTDFWMQLMFVDNSGSSSQSPIFSERLLQEHIYDRWIGYSTIFGVTRYSFIALTNLGDYPVKFIASHVKGRYFELVQLSLVQRISALRFSDEVTGIVVKKNSRNLAVETDTLYEEYLRFINKIYFREPTAQEQGIELYGLLQKSMGIENEVKNLAQEIQELHNYVMLKAEDKRNTTLDTLTFVGSIFAVFSLILGVLGTNYFGSGDDLKVDPLKGGIWFNKSLENNSVVWLFIMCVALPIMLSIIMFLIRYLLKKR